MQKSGIPPSPPSAAPAVNRMAALLEPSRSASNLSENSYAVFGPLRETALAV
jgi:hypothetical protein